MTPAPTPPSGESAPPSLEEQEKPNGRLIARLIVARDEISDLRAEVARLTAGWEAEVRRTAELREAMDAAGILRQRVNGRLWAIPARESAQLAAAEARAARAEEALRDICNKRQHIDCHRDAEVAYLMTDIAARALTEGADHE